MGIIKSINKMSWSINLIIGKPEKVVEALEKIPSTFSDPQSKKELEDVLPHIIGIVKQNFGDENKVVKVSASGHGYSKDGVDINRSCIVTIEAFYANLV
jgi:hypothetical protein